MALGQGVPHHTALSCAKMLANSRTVSAAQDAPAAASWRSSLRPRPLRATQQLASGCIALRLVDLEGLEPSGRLHLNRPPPRGRPVKMRTPPLNRAAFCMDHTCASRSKRSSWVIPRGRVSTQCRTSSSRQPTLLTTKANSRRKLSLALQAPQGGSREPREAGYVGCSENVHGTPPNCMMVHVVSGAIRDLS